MWNWNDFREWATASAERAVKWAFSVALPFLIFTVAVFAGWAGAVAIIVLVLETQWLEWVYRLLPQTPGLPPFPDSTDMSLAIGVASISGALLLGLYEKLRELMKSVLSFYFEETKTIGNAWSTSKDILSIVLASSATLFLGVYGIVDASSESETEDFNGIPAIIAFNNGSSSYSPPPSQPLTFYMTFREEISALGDSLDSDKGQRALAESVVTTLSACLRDGEASTVELDIVGFASSSGTDSLNLSLANKRSVWTKDYIDSLKAENGAASRFFTRQVQHQRFEDMERGLFRDRVELEGQYSVPAGALNRRVELRARRLGDCDVQGSMNLQLASR